MPATLRSLVSGVLALIIPPPDVAVGAGESHVSAAGAYNKVDVNGDDAALTLDATGGREFTFAEIKVASNGTLRISGDARIHVQGRLEITNGGTIEFADAGSRAVFFTADDVVIADAGAGVPSSVARIADRDAADLSQYSAPSRLVIAPLPVADGGKAAPFVQIDNGSLVVANIHAPTAVVTVTNGATLIGRATGGTFAMATGTTLLYDCMLDHRNGFSESDGPLYKADGTPIDGLASALGSFNSLLGPDALVGHLIGSMPVEFDLGEESIALGGGPVITPRARGRVEASPWPTIVRGMEETGGTSGGGGNAPPPGLLVEWNDENLYCFEPRTTNEDVDDDDTDAQVWVDDDGVGKSGTQIMQEPF